MSHSQFHCTGRVYLDLHGLIFETSICYWQDQPGSLWWKGLLTRTTYSPRHGTSKHMTRAEASNCMPQPTKAAMQQA